MRESRVRTPDTARENWVRSCQRLNCIHRLTAQAFEAHVCLKRNATVLSDGLTRHLSAGQHQVGELRKASQSVTIYWPAVYTK
jgi:hypothetical protein